MNMRISSLMDDELDDRDIAALLKSLKGNPELRDRWDCYHLIGDAIRDYPVLSADFSGKLSQRLSQEPAVLAPVAVSSPPIRSSLPSRSWVALSAAASLVAVGLGVWVATQASTGTPPVPLAGRPAQIREAALPVSSVKEYLFFHQEYSPSTDMQGVAPYVRTVSETRQDGFR